MMALDASLWILWECKRSKCWGKRAKEEQNAALLQATFLQAYGIRRDEEAEEIKVWSHTIETRIVFGL